MFKYQNYFIATDANHVTQHRRVVTPWFYVRLKSIKYIKLRFTDFEDFTFWAIDSGKDYISSSDTIYYKSSLNDKLEAVTLPFSFDERIAK